MEYEVTFVVVMVALMALLSWPGPLPGIDCLLGGHPDDDEAAGDRAEG